MSGYSPKRVHVFGPKSSVSEGKSARFTFSRGWAHLAFLIYPAAFNMGLAFDEFPATCLE
jgi:hypothetical protein